LYLYLYLYLYVYLFICIFFRFLDFFIKLLKIEILFENKYNYTFFSIGSRRLKKMNSNVIIATILISLILYGIKHITKYFLTLLIKQCKDILNYFELREFKKSLPEFIVVLSQSDVCDNPFCHHKKNNKGEIMEQIYNIKHQSCKCASNLHLDCLANTDNFCRHYYIEYEYIK